MFIKRNLIIALSFIAITANAQKLDGFFHYYKLSNAMRLAFDDYLADNTDNCNSIFIMDINSNDTTKVVFVEGSFSALLTNPPFYFSCYKNKILFIYTGKERNYYPSNLDISYMFDFISGIVDTCEFDVISWKDYTFRFKEFKHKKDCNKADDKLVYLYNLSKDVMDKKPSSNIKIKAYLQLKFQPKFIK